MSLAKCVLYKPYQRNIPQRSRFLSHFCLLSACHKHRLESISRKKNLIAPQPQCKKCETTKSEFRREPAKCWCNLGLSGARLWEGLVMKNSSSCHHSCGSRGMCGLNTPLLTHHTHIILHLLIRLLQNADPRRSLGLEHYVQQHT